MNDNTDSPIPQQQHWIGGQQTVPSTGQYMPVLNPVDDSIIALAAEGSTADVDRAVQSADEAFQTYRNSLPQNRERWLCRAADLLEQDADQFRQLLIDEVGSPVIKADREIQTSARILRAAAGAVRHLTGRTFPTDIPGRISMGVRRPLGVVAGLTPFNVPLIKNVKHSAMALATGNTVVLLPSQEAPLTACLLGQLYQQAGFPDGAFNVVTGRGADIGESLITDARVRFVGFTGSLAVGQIVSQLCGQHRKRYTLEMGGKNSLVVLNDADLELAVPAAVAGSFFYQGQICMASSRICVQQDILPAFMKAFVRATEQLKTGDLRDPQTMIGPVINPAQRQRIKDHIRDAVDHGAQVVTGAHWHGNVCEPTILANVDAGMHCFSQETFGPVTAVLKAESADHALSLANAAGCGLSASVFTASLDKAMTFAEQLQAGMVHVNATTIQEEPHIPFGGVGDSGLGREGTILSADDLTEWKWITLRG